MIGKAEICFDKQSIFPLCLCIIPYAENPRYIKNIPRIFAEKAKCISAVLFNTADIGRLYCMKSNNRAHMTATSARVALLSGLILPSLP